jgi:hypothetical protein
MKEGGLGAASRAPKDRESPARNLLYRHAPIIAPIVRKHSN